MWAVAVVLVFGACTERTEAPRATPKPLAALEPVRPDAGAPTAEEDPLFTVVPLSPRGPVVPPGARVVRLDGERALVDGQPVADARALKGPVVLEVVGETWLVQAAPFLAALDDAGVDTYFRHPDVAVAYRVRLRDEKAFQAWLEEPVPGKLRVIQRGDGFELQTNMGKLPGGDPNGPTVPLRGGQMDLSTLRRGLERLRARFDSAPDYCLMPSFGTELAQAARAMAADYRDDGEAIFPGTCLVYPRPARDAGR